MQFVELPEFLAERAVQLLHNRNMQNRYIEVFVSSEAEANQANVAPPMQLPMHMQMAALSVAATGSPPGWAALEGGATMSGLVRLRGRTPTLTLTLAVFLTLILTLAVTLTLTLILARCGCAACRSTRHPSRCCSSSRASSRRGASRACTWCSAP